MSIHSKDDVGSLADDNTLRDSPETSVEPGGVAPEQELQSRTTEPLEDDAAAEKDDVYSEVERSPLQILLVMLALSIAVFLAAIDISIVTTALPTITEHFHSASGYTWIGTAYLLGSAASTPVWGKLSDIYGRKPVLLMANVMFFVGSLVAALATSMGMLIAARAIQGIAGGGLLVLPDILIGDLFSPRKRSKYYALIGATWAVAITLGPILGGVFAEKVSWRWCFYINLPLDGLAFAIILVYLDVKTPKTPFWAGIKAIDWLGSFSVVGATVMFLFGIEYGGNYYPWTSATVLCLIIFGLLTFVVFFFIEWKIAKYPVLPARVFNRRTNVAALLVCFFHGMVSIGLFYYLPLYFQTVLGESPILSGVYILPISVALAIGAICVGILIEKTGQYKPLIWGPLLLVTLGTGLLINLPAYKSWPRIILYQGLVALGVGPVFQSPLIALQAHNSPGDVAAATSAFNLSRNIASAFGVVIAQVIFQNQMAKKSTSLIAAVGPAIAAQIGGGNAGASANIIDMLSPGPRAIVREALNDSLKYVWVFFTCIAALGFLSALMISTKTLNTEHRETETGLDAQERYRLDAEKEKVKGKEEAAEAKSERRRGHGQDMEIESPM